MKSDAPPLLFFSTQSHAACSHSTAAAVLAQASLHVEICKPHVFDGQAATFCHVERSSRVGSPIRYEASCDPLPSIVIFEVIVEK